MSRNNKKKNSTSKYRKFKVSPLISVMAVIEVIILIAISTYAWFIIVQEKEASTGVIAVNADSGLDIDFKNANYDDEINIWDYVDNEFSFEPVTSLDGRNVFVPTSGTFDATSTNSMYFRDATINDINDKYLNVDFMLTNTTESDMDVYLGNASKFKVWNNNVDSNSRALRLAFYTNDGQHGKVDSSILANTNNENAILDGDDENTYTVYFQNSNSWSDVYAYSWRRVSNTDYPVMQMPGSKMTRICGNIYSYTFSNPMVDTNNDDVPDTRMYTHILFNNGSGNYTAASTKTRDLTLVNGNIYYLNDSNLSQGRAYSTKTIYFRKPSDWNKIYANAYNGSSTLTGFPGDEMTNCGADIYSYTFPASTYPNVKFNDGTNSHESNQVNVTASGVPDPPLYYFTSSSNGTPSVIKYEERTIYFYNSQNFSKPYCKISTASGHTTEVPMTNLSAGVFYATIPSVYTTVVFEDGTGATQNTKYTRSDTVTDGYIYKPVEKTGTGWTLTKYSYTGYVGTEGQDPYAVISPGVSAGFQRAYTPVVDIAATNGAATQLIPAFASSIDNYILGSGEPLFTIPAGGMRDLSMVIWLEGTDADCTNENYASTDLSPKEIELYLEFATTNVYRDNVDNVPRYTYRFYDKTRECWTSDRLTNEAGISIAPVIQMYDATDKRGYLMHAASTTNVGGTKKVDLWECQAPSTIYTAGHDIYYRRVDPYNEDEVWNYWHPGAAVSDARSTIDGKQYISFTAFADGAPASSSQDAAGVNGNNQYVQAATIAHTPAKSCGGLWGTYQTTLFTAVDGTDQFKLADSGGVITMHYTYKYPNSNTTHEIEYKASGPYNSQCYYFVVPTTLLNNSNVHDYRFNRFWSFESDYAMNIYKRNSSMSAHANDIFTTGSSVMGGYYALMTHNPSGKSSANNYCYFGQDLMYVNISYKDEGNNNNLFNGARFKIHYWNKSNASQNVDHYLYTNNGNFQLNNYNGYLTVVPVYSGSVGFNVIRGNSSTFVQIDQNKTADITFSSSNHNLVLYKWSGQSILYNYDNGVQSSWPKVPSYD